MGHRCPHPTLMKGPWVRAQCRPSSRADPEAAGCPEPIPTAGFPRRCQPGPAPPGALGRPGHTVGVPVTRGPRNRTQRLPVQPWGGAPRTGVHESPGSLAAAGKGWREGRVGALHGPAQSPAGLPVHCPQLAPPPTCHIPADTGPRAVCGGHSSQRESSRATGPGEPHGGLTRPGHSPAQPRPVDLRPVAASEAPGRSRHSGGMGRLLDSTLRKSARQGKGHGGALSLRKGGSSRWGCSQDW